MIVLPLIEARNRLSELVDEVNRTHERIEITRRGHAVAILISPDDVLGTDELATLMAKRSKRAPGR